MTEDFLPICWVVLVLVVLAVLSGPLVALEALAGGVLGGAIVIGLMA